MEILSIPIDTDRKDFGVVNDIKKAYADVDGIFGTCIFADKNLDNDPDDTPFICARIFIQNPEKITDSQKFIVALQSHDYGRHIVIDVISLNKEYHKNIAYDYCQRTGKVSSSTKSNDEFQSTNEVPIGFAGGSVLVDDELCFTGQSLDYGNFIYGVNCNNLASYIAQCCQFDAVGETKSGEDYIKDLLQLMVSHRGSGVFYEKWVADQVNRLDHQPENQLLSQQMGAIINMKVLDRYLHEGGDFLRIRIEENTQGLSRNYLLEVAAQKIRNNLQ